MPDDTRPRLLVVDDERGVLAFVDRFAQGQGFDVITRAGGHALLAELPAIKPDVALLDRNMPQVGGLEILGTRAETDPACQVILMTANATVDSAIEAVKLGALDYLSKPLDFDRLSELLSTVRHSIDRRQRPLAADSELASRFEFYGMIGRSPVMYAGSADMVRLRRAAAAIVRVIVTASRESFRATGAGCPHKSERDAAAAMSNRSLKKTSVDLTVHRMVCAVRLCGQPAAQVLRRQS